MRKKSRQKYVTYLELLIYIAVNDLGIFLFLANAYPGIRLEGTTYSSYWLIHTMEELMKKIIHFFS